MIPTEAYRDEGTSYHYAPASDYIGIKNCGIVREFMEKNHIPYVMGRTWTTGAFYRETVRNFEKHKAGGCISVEMEGSAAQAVYDRNPVCKPRPSLLARGITRPTKHKFKACGTAARSFLRRTGTAFICESFFCGILKKRCKQKLFFHTH